MLTLRGADHTLFSPVEFGLFLALLSLFCVCLLVYVKLRATQKTASPLRHGLLLLFLSLQLIAVGASAVMTLRGTKGSSLTYTELDNNFITLQNWSYTTAGGMVWTIDPGSAITSGVTTIPAAGGAAYSTLAFTDATTDILYAAKLRAPVGWTTGTLRVTGSGVHIGASPAGKALGFDIAAQCRKDGEAFNNSWGTAQTLTIPFATQNQQETARTVAITPDGTCTGGTEDAPVYVNVRLRVNTGIFACAPTPSECLLTNADVQYARP